MDVSGWSYPLKPAAVNRAVKTLAGYYISLTSRHIADLLLKPQEMMPTLKLPLSDTNIIL